MSSKKKTGNKIYVTTQRGAMANETVAKAMRQVDRAMQQVKRNCVQVRGNDSSDSSSSDDETVDMAKPSEGAVGHCPALTIDKKGVKGKGRTVIHVQNSNNIQIGSNNVMIVNNVKPSRRKSSEDLEEDRPPVDKDELTQEQKDMLGSDRLINQKDIRTATTVIGVNWKRMARLLGMDDNSIEHIRMTHGQDSREMIYQCLIQWQQIKYSEATLGKLLTVLLEVQKDKNILKKFEL